MLKADCEVWEEKGQLQRFREDKSENVKICLPRQHYPVKGKTECSPA